MSVICRHILNGLAFVHNVLDMPHRNIRLSTVSIGTDYQCKIPELDIVSEHVVDVSGWAIGEAYRVAPEVSCNNTYGKKADIWSLGVLLWEMCLQGHPLWFSQQSRLSYLRLKRGTLVLGPDQPQQLLSVCDPYTGRSYSSGLCDFLGCCLRFHENERASASELLQHPFITASCSIESDQFLPGLLSSSRNSRVRKN